VNREQFYAIMNGEGTLDYEVYLRTKTLLGCQTDYAEMCNKH
jgi:tryptophan 2,3-dioxygenase